MHAQTLYKSRYHWSYYLLLLTGVLILYRCYLEIIEYSQRLQSEPDIPFYTGMSFSMIFLPLIIYGFIFLLGNIGRVTITTAGVRIRRRYFSADDIAAVRYQRKDFKFLIASQTQQAVVFTLQTGDEVIIWCQHYRNGT